MVSVIVLAIVIGSIVCAILSINWPAEILVGLVSSLIVAMFPLCTKILEKHNNNIDEPEKKEEETII
jgi:glycerol-3-phosphate acyltransferase PlsY